MKKFWEFIKSILKIEKGSVVTILPFCDHGDFDKFITYSIGTKVAVDVPKDDIDIFGGHGKFIGIIVGSYLGTDRRVHYLIYANWLAKGGSGQIIEKLYDLSTKDYTISGVRQGEKKSQDKIHSILDMYGDIKNFCNNACILDCGTECPFYKYETNKSRKEHLS